MSDKPTIGFIGIGVMGASMAGHLIDAGYRVLAYTRTKAKAEGLLAKGAEWRDSVAALAPQCGAIFTMVGYPSDVEQVYFGADGLIERATRGSLLIDCTTSSPVIAARIYEAAKSKGLRALDAPVSGGDLGARNATLTIMVGGDPADFEAARPMFETIGKTVVLQGKAGSGQHTKMANQIAIAGALLGACESMKYAEAAGLDPRTVLLSISGGSASSWQLVNLAPKMLDGDFKPGFYSKHFLKDLRIALESAAAMGANLPALANAERLFGLLVERGGGDEATHAMYKLYREGLA
jgi:3-hydroxyisobutyrate dehydrogenase